MAFQCGRHASRAGAVQGGPPAHPTVHAASLCRPIGGPAPHRQLLGAKGQHQRQQRWQQHVRRGLRQRLAVQTKSSPQESGSSGAATIDNLAAMMEEDAAAPAAAAGAVEEEGEEDADGELRLELDTAEAVRSVSFTGVPSTLGTDIAIAEVAPGSAAQRAGLGPGQRLLALSDPVRADEMWALNERASLRFVRDAFRMRRAPTITLHVTRRPLLLQAMREMQQAESSKTVAVPRDEAVRRNEAVGGVDLLNNVAASEGQDTGSSGGDESDDDGAWSSTSATEESVRLVGLKLDPQPGMTIGQALEAQYRSARPAVSAYRKRKERRKERLSEVSGRNDSRFFAIVGAFFLFPALAILVIAYTSGYLDSLQRSTFY